MASCGTLGILRLSPSGTVEIVAGNLFLGRPVGELAGHSVAELWPDQPAIHELARAALAGGEGAVAVDLGDGCWELRAVVERGPGGEPCGMLLVSIDRTERARAEADASRERAFLDSLIENLPDMVFVKTADELRFVRFNRAAEELLGYGRGEMIGKNDYDFFPVTEADFFTEKDRAVLRGGQLLDIPEEPIHTRDKGTRILHTKKIPIYDSDGTPLYLLGIAEDVTAQKQALAERRELERLRTELIANVSHEFRTPLTLIQAHLARLAPHVRDDDREQVAGITQSVQTLLALVDDLLDLARLEAGKLAIDYAEVDLGRLVRRVAGSFEVVASAKAIELVIDAPDLVAQVDPERIQRVASNLVVNAIRHAPYGGRVRCVVQRVGTASEGRVRIVIADSGPGIPAEQRERVFERFFQAAGDRFGGVGLGLALVRDLVELHGGRVWAGQAREGGAELVVELPLRAPAGVALRSHVPAEAGLVPPRITLPRVPMVTRRDGPIVLVCEDHPELNQMLVEALAEHYQVAAVFDGQAGLARATELAPDLVITDLMMPGLSGDRMIDAIRANPVLDTVPILVLTACADDAMRARLLAGGAQDYLQKPFSLDELLARAHNLISLKRARDVLGGELATSRASVAELARELARRTHHARFLADASAALSRTLDYQGTLSEVARLAVPGVADACAVDVAEAGVIRRAAISAIDPSAAALLDDPVHAIVVPLVARERRVGALALAWTPERGHDAAELALAEELATRAALAIDNAWLHREARTAIEHRDEFLSIASHELRTPLTPLVLAVQSLAALDESAESDPIRRKLLESAIRQVERLVRLIDELLDVTRIDEGLELARAQTELGDLVEQVVARWSPELGRAGCEVSLHRDGPIVGCWDALKIEQVVANLLANAIKFGAGTPIEIEVGQDVERAHLAVTDHGLGIDRERQRRIFDRYERAVPARNYGGLGLGLYICRRIVEAHGGTITVASEPGAGSTFTVELPL
jgi:PAS domain S-box-containing protein